jgi:hypothetical protein
MQPVDRNTFKEFCLRSLGKPVIEINVDDDQLDDRVDEAIQYYWDYHFDGTEMVYYKHQIQQQDITNKFIFMPENIIGAVEVFSISDPSIHADSLFNIRYQIALNDMYSLTSVSMIPYYMVMEHLALVTEFLVGKQPIRYNRISNKLYVDMDWNMAVVGLYFVIRAYQVVDPAEYPLMWRERWLQRYATALIKRQWGTNLKKFDGIALIGGATFNGQKIYDEAIIEIAKMEQEMITSFSLPVMDFVA